MIEFGKPRELKEYCPLCGRPIYEGDKGCPTLHKIKTKKRFRPDFSGKSKSINKFNDYKD